MLNLNFNDYYYYLIYMPIIITVLYRGVISVDDKYFTVFKCNY